MMLSGPQISSKQIIPTLTSLNDIYPTVLAMARISNVPANLPGSSLLSLLSTNGSPHEQLPAARKDYVVAQYHSVFSVTGSFMIRQGVWKLIEFGPNQPFGLNFKPQLFNMKTDPWELHDVAGSSPDVVNKLSSLLHTELNVSAVDAQGKAVQRQLFMDTAWKGSAQCQQTFEAIYGKGSLNATDFNRISTWARAPCPFSRPSRPDPTCAAGIKDSTGKVCCKKSCRVCAHPSAACRGRPGGAKDCCPSFVQKAGKSCSTQGAPCVIE